MFIRDIVNARKVTIEYFHTTENAAHTLTKALSVAKLLKCLKTLGVRLNYVNCFDMKKHNSKVKSVE